MDIKQMGCNGYLHGLVRSIAGFFAGVCLKLGVPKNSVISLINHTVPATFLSELQAELHGTSSANMSLSSGCRKSVAMRPSPARVFVQDSRTWKIMGYRIINGRINFRPFNQHRLIPKYMFFLFDPFLAWKRQINPENCPFPKGQSSSFPKFHWVLCWLGRVVSQYPLVI